MPGTRQGPPRTPVPAVSRSPGPCLPGWDPPLTGALTPNFNYTEWSMHLNQHWQRPDCHPALPPQEESGGPTEKGSAPVIPGLRETQWTGAGCSFLTSWASCASPGNTWGQKGEGQHLRPGALNVPQGDTQTSRSPTEPRLLRIPSSPPPGIRVFRIP